MAWAMSNAVERADHNGNIMLDKAKSRERIDPVVALMNAHARAMHHGTEGAYDPNKYATEDILDKLWG
ncbi:MAG TPA: terminase large subunit, partial [Firmicutes bacterium]|nr:terminase large subunit [Bacillota bacterium]